MNDFLIMISAGLIDGVAMMILIYSLRRIEASFFSITHYSQIIFGIVISIVVFNHYPSIIEILGAILVIISGYLIYSKLKKLGWTKQKLEQSSMQLIGHLNFKLVAW